ncbi:MAG: DUF3857 domain-containing protein [Candidatus Omnitrophota bacterium]
MAKKYFFIFLSLIIFLSACNQREDYSRIAKKQADNAQIFYEGAVLNYIKAISQNNLPHLHFELGKLYYEHGDYKEAIIQLKDLDQKFSSKYLALSYFKEGDYTNALNIFERNILVPDSESLYYFGLTCEKLNLFEKAIGIYLKIKDKKFSNLAQQRIKLINLGGKNSRIEDSFIRDLITSSRGQAEHPEAGAIILLADETVEILPDNKVIYNEHFLIKILNDRGKKDFAEVNINYDSTYEKVELEYARTIKPDGNIVLVGEKNIRDVSRYLNFPLYSNARSRIISMPEVAPGAIIEYKAKIVQNKMIAEKEFNIEYALENTNPIKLAKFKIIFPKNNNLFTKNINSKYNKNNFMLDPKVTITSNEKIYYWEFRDVPQIISEADTPAISRITPIILISSFDSWEEIYAWWAGLSFDKIKSSPEIKKQVTELIKGKLTDLEKAQSIFNYCSANIRYVAVEYGQAGYEPHQAQDIFNNKYGDCKDQAVLLITMLREANLEAYPVLISTKDFINLERSFPSALFNHAIAVVKIDGKLYFLDPTAETSSLEDLPFDDQNRNVLVFKDDYFEIEETPFYGADKNKIIYNVEIIIDQDGKAQGKREITAFGQFALFQRYWLRYSPPEVIKQVLNERLQEVATGAKLINYEIKDLYNPDKPITLTYTFNAGTILISAGNLKMLPELATIELSKVAKEKRIYPLYLGFPNTIEVRMKFKLDPSYTCKYLPQPVKNDSEWFSFEDNYVKNNNEIEFYQKQKITAEEISIEDYPIYKKLLEGLKDQINQRIILEKII